MIYTDGFNKIESPYKWIDDMFTAVFDGEDTTKETFYPNADDKLIKEQQQNYNENYGVNYKITDKQRLLLKNKYNKLKDKYGE